MSNDTLNKVESLDLQVLKMISEAQDEAAVEIAIRHFTPQYSGLMFNDKVKVIKRHYGGNLKDDGTIYFQNIPVGINESKYGEFAGKVNGEPIYAVFSQCAAYIYLSKCTTLKFIWISHNHWFRFIKFSDNRVLVDLIKELCSTQKKLTPSKFWDTCKNDLSVIFNKMPLLIHRSWDITDNFKFSEVIEETLQIIY